ncbi:MAG: VWA domain-containing protein, partial [Lentisphaerae bacterium]|nr:VWA domain-containing protein [Lentisphaerota bacterium]
DVAAEITCLLALSAIKNQDNVGLILFSDRIEKSVPPRKGRTAAMRLVREVLAAEETRRGTNIAAALRFLNNVQKRKAVVFIVSDFMDNAYEKELRVTARKHDVICCPISDPLEIELPNAGLVEVQDPETGQLLLVDTRSALLRSNFQHEMEQHNQALQTLFRRLKIDTLNLSTTHSFVDAVRKLFRQRQARAGRG